MTFKSFLYASVCLPALIIGANAHADELEPTDKSWSGYYFGTVGTLGLTSTLGAISYGGIDGNSFGATFGGTLGVNFQQGNFVYGLEGDFSLSGLGGSGNLGNASNYKFLSDWDWLATLRARGGVATGPIFLYATGGLAITHANLFACEDEPCALPDSNSPVYKGTLLGLAGGFGVEYALGNGISMKAEYLYVGFPSKFSNKTSDGSATFYSADLGTSAHLARFGFNYNFHQTPAAMASDLHDWTGGYVGLATSVGLMSAAGNSFYGGHEAWDYAGAVGVTAGYNFQRGSILWGLEADIQAGRLSATADYDTSSSYKMTGKWDWYSTLRARAGIATGNAVLYGTAGLAVADVNLQSCYQQPCALPYNRSPVYRGLLFGLAAGAGVEYAVGENLSFKAEYLYLGFPSKYSMKTSDGSATLSETHLTTSAHLLRTGLNYNLGGGMPAESRSLHDWSGAYLGISAVGGLAYTAGAQYYGGGVGTQFGGTLGLSAGFNWQRANFVYGIEADIQGPGLSAKSDFYTDSYYKVMTDWNWFSTLRARAGVATGYGLLYATGGVAIADLNLRSCYTDACDPSDTNTFKGVKVGLTAGLGFEYALSQALSFKAEYQYIGFGNELLTKYGDGTPASYQFDQSTSANIVKIGFNYNLN